MKRTVVLAPGHGGFDPGAVNSSFGYRESDCALSISLLAGRLLENKGLTVLYTRTEDRACGGAKTVAEDIKNQLDFINSSGAELAISVHLNSFTDKSANGTETLYSVLKAPGTKEKAEIIQRRVIEATGLRNRGVKQRDELGVLKRAAVPTVILEVCFISNDEECIWGVDSAKQAIVARAICEAAMECLGFEEEVEKVSKSGNEKEVYINIDQLPSWGRAAVEAAMKCEDIEGLPLLRGKADGSLDLSEDLLRMLVIMHRAGVF